ncbi:hypothetical protein CHUAL_009678 [Chamberlinius hualienensis]
MAVDNVLEPIDLQFDLETDSDDDYAVIIPREITYNHVRLHSLTDVRRFCERNQVMYNPEDFDFKTKIALEARLPVEPDENEQPTSSIDEAMNEPVGPAEPVAASETKDGKSTEAED